MNTAISSKGCPQEARVMRAARTGRWDDALESHAAVCPACGEMALVSGRLRALALETESRHRLPSPYLLWLKAQLTERQVASQRASKPWDAAEALGLGVVALALAGWLVADGASLSQGLVEWMPVRQLNQWSQVWSLMSALSVPLPVALWTLIGLICVATLFVVEPLLSDD